VRNQCRKPIPERIAYKDKVNECSVFSPRVTVARDVKPAAGTFQQMSPTRRTASPLIDAAPKTSRDAKAAFDSLFKK
jgi:hypothetical protein